MSAGLPPILLVGGGKMGGALLSGWREQGLAPSVVIDPAPESRVLASASVTVVTAPAEVPEGFRPQAVVLAVKPQVAAAVVPGIVPRLSDAVVLSIMAGKTTAGLQQLLGAAPIVRAMPNTPASVRRGITVAVAGHGVAEAQRALCHRLLEAVGSVEWVEDEAMIDAVTAVSGGGPAYVFLLTELLEKAGVEQGLSQPLARHLARETVAGAGALLAASTDEAADLRIAVTSPGGTTQQALAILMQEWPGPVSRAIAAATHRSRELAS